MSESKPVTFRSKYERYQTYIGDRPANLETNMPAKAGKQISFSRFVYTTSDEKEIALLRKQADELPGVIIEVKPEKRVKIVELDEGQSVTEALEKTLEAEKTQLTQEESTKTKAKK